MKMSNVIPCARKAALYLILGVMKDAQPLLELCARHNGPLAKLGPADRAHALRLARAVFRNQAAIDSVLGQYVKLKKTPRTVLCVLRLCAVELWVFQTPPYAVVDSANNLAKTMHSIAHLKGLINAVARKIAKHSNVDLHANPQPLPTAMRSQLEALFDTQRIAAIEVAHQYPPPIDLTLKHPKQAESWAAKLNAKILPQGSLRLQEHVQISALPGFEAGDWWVQDAAAALPAQLIKGQRVLDICAAPGGKTLQLATMGAHVTALDYAPERLKRLKENLARTRLHAEIICADARQYHAQQPYDAILLDAPCSASGTIRRHPDLPFIKGNANFAALVRLQRAILTQASKLLKPNGQLIYATCSLFHAESEAQAQWASAHLPLIPKRIDASALGLPKDFSNAAGQLRLSPDLWAKQGGIDGFFVAEFRAKP